MIRHLPWAGPLVVILLAQPLFADVAPPEGYKPTKKIVRLFEAKCATCHGDDGKAKTEVGKEMAIGDMTKAAYWKDLTLEGSRKAVLEGIKRTFNGVEQEMKPFKDRLSPEQVEALVIYSASLKK